MAPNRERKASRCGSSSSFVDRLMDRYLARYGETKFTDVMPVFDPLHDLGQLIIAGRVDLPSGMVISAAHSDLLPKSNRGRRNQSQPPKVGEKRKVYLEYIEPNSPMVSVTKASHLHHDDVETLMPVEHIEQPTSRQFSTHLAAPTVNCDSHLNMTRDRNPSHCSSPNNEDHHGVHDSSVNRSAPAKEEKSQSRATIAAVETYQKYISEYQVLREKHCHVAINTLLAHHLNNNTLKSLTDTRFDPESDVGKLVLGGRLRLPRKCSVPPKFRQLLADRTEQHRLARMAMLDVAKKAVEAEKHVPRNERSTLNLKTTIFWLEKDKYPMWDPRRFQSDIQDDELPEAKRCDVSTTKQPSLLRTVTDESATDGPSSSLMSPQPSPLAQQETQGQKMGSPKVLSPARAVTDDHALSRRNYITPDVNPSHHSARASAEDKDLEDYRRYIAEYEALRAKHCDVEINELLAYHLNSNTLSSLGTDVFDPESDMGRLVLGGRFRLPDDCFVPFEHRQLLRERTEQHRQARAAMLEAARNALRLEQYVPAHVRSNIALGSAIGWLRKDKYPMWDPRRERGSVIDRYSRNNSNSSGAREHYTAGAVNMDTETSPPMPTRYFTTRNASSPPSSAPPLNIVTGESDAVLSSPPRSSLSASLQCVNSVKMDTTDDNLPPSLILLRTLLAPRNGSTDGEDVHHDCALNVRYSNTPDANPSYRTARAPAEDRYVDDYRRYVEEYEALRAKHCDVEIGALFEYHIRNKSLATETMTTFDPLSDMGRLVLGGRSSLPSRCFVPVEHRQLLNEKTEEHRRACAAMLQVARKAFQTEYHIPAYLRSKINFSSTIRWLERGKYPMWDPRRSDSRPRRREDRVSSRNSEGARGYRGCERDLSPEPSAKRARSTYYGYSQEQDSSNTIHGASSDRGVTERVREASAHEPGRAFTTGPATVQYIPLGTTDKVPAVAVAAPCPFTSSSISPPLSSTVTKEASEEEGPSVVDTVRMELEKMEKLYKEFMAQ